MKKNQTGTAWIARCKQSAIGIALALIFPGVHAASQPSPDNTPEFNRRAWQEDYAWLKKQMELNYANLAWFASTEMHMNLPELNNRTLAALNAASSDEEARAAIDRFKAGFPDGHFSIYPDPAPRQGATPIPDPAAADLSHADAKTACAAFGFTNNGMLDFSLPFAALQGFHLETDGLSTTLRSGILETAQGIRFGLIRVQSFVPRDYNAACLKVWEKLGAAGKPRDTHSVADSVQDAWYADVAATLKRFEAAHVDAVIVDVGNNRGGNDSGDISARLFTKHDVHSARLYMVNSDISRRQFESGIKELKEELAKVTHPDAKLALQTELDKLTAGLKQLGQHGCDMSWVWRETHPWSADAACSRLVRMGSAGGPLDFLPENAFNNPDIAQTLHWPSSVDGMRGAWNGPVYVLTDRKSYSSAEMFSAVMHDNGIARTVGDRTGGDGCGFMSYASPEILPNSRLRIRMPNCMRLRADGTSEVAGIAPDLPVLPTPGESPLARAARAIDVMSTDLQQRRGDAGQSKNPRTN